jgi:hypothetical protein
MQLEVIRSDMETKVSEILFYVWDPIGVNGMPTCRDEYDSYVPIVSAYLLHNFDEVGVDALLMFIMEESIGVGLTKLPRRKSQHFDAMRMLMEWKQDFLLKHPDTKSSAPQFPKAASFLEQIDWSRQQVRFRHNPQLLAVPVTIAEKS